MVDSVKLYQLASRRIVAGTVSQIAMYAPLAGSVVTNPFSAEDQDIDPAEVLYISITGNPAANFPFDATFGLLPGESFVVPADLAVNVTVAAPTTGHRFSGFVKQLAPPFPPEPFVGPFPPDGPTSLIEAIPSYLYWQYRDDEPLQASRDAYNAEAQRYVDWFNAVNLPVYTGLSGDLLDWVAEGLYGIARPSLPAGVGVTIGPFDTFVINGAPFNFFDVEGDDEFYATSDDTFKRIITWAFYKDDGKAFSIRWLKRRIARFLGGVDGVSFNVDQTYDVSIELGPDNEVHINVGTYAPLLKSAIDAGVLELPFQYEFIVTTG